jgi:hypothetical protein
MFSAKTSWVFLPSEVAADAIRTFRTEFKGQKPVMLRKDTMDDLMRAPGTLVLDKADSTCVFRALQFLLLAKETAAPLAHCKPKTLAALAAGGGRSQTGAAEPPPMAYVAWPLGLTCRHDIDLPEPFATSGISRLNACPVRAGAAGKTLGMLFQVPQEWTGL